MNPESHRPIEHQRVIALLKEAQAPPADSETPDIPNELLERLRGQYGRAPRRAIQEEKPRVWARLCDLFVQPRLAFAMALVLVCGVATVLLRVPQPQQGDDLLRGGQPQQIATPVYWVQSDQAEPAPSGLGLPKFIVITAHEPLPEIGEALILDPAHGEARATKNGSITARIPVADPTDSNEWLSVHRQLRKLLVP